MAERDVKITLPTTPVVTIGTTIYITSDVKNEGESHVFQRSNRMPKRKSGQRISWRSLSELTAQR